MKVLLLVSILSQLGATTIDQSKRFAWSSNTGWLAFRTDTEGISVTESFLFGNAWSPNLGWLNFGDGTPGNNYSYSNTKATDSGVNLDKLGNLSGLAWSANAGWVNFGWATSSDPNRPRIDLRNGSFEGYAWSANTGWLNLAGNDLATNFVITNDLDGDGIGDAWEWQHFDSLKEVDETTDFDCDGTIDLLEYFALSDPLIFTDEFGPTSTVISDGPPRTEKVSFKNAHPGRSYQLFTSTDLITWKPVYPATSPTLVVTFNFNVSHLPADVPARFYRMEIKKNLQSN